MSNLPLGDELQRLFGEVTKGTYDGPPVRAILVQNENGILQLVESMAEEGTDKEDFSNVLGKLFAKEPTKPGYALYRLDSKSPAGLFEWLNCAYRPEGAKVREKMQYSITQASLFEGLSEQHFLETVYGATSDEFAFPPKLRNQRRHDYQNPQQSTTGKRPDEAAGTGTAGRRNFDATTPSPGTLPQRSTTAKQESRPSQEPLTSPTSGVTQAIPAPDASVPPEATRQLSPPETIVEPNPLPASEEEKETANEGEKELAQGIAQGEGVDVDAREEIQATEREGDKSSSGGGIQDPLADAAPLAAIDANGQKEEAEDDDPEPSLAPSARPELTKEAVEEARPTPEKTTPAVMTAAAAATTAALSKPSTTSVGTGTGAQGLETTKERNLADLKGEESRLKSEGKQGGSHLGFGWQDDVEPALRGLAKKLGGTSEWNLVVVKIDLSKEQVELASQPRFVPPGDFSDALPQAEPCYAFYSHPDMQREGEESSRVVVVYVCPLHSSVRQRMLFSANLAITVNRVAEIQGLTIEKRIETSDPKELTAAFFAEELLGASPAETGQAKALSRPKRPGRK